MSGTLHLDCWRCGRRQTIVFDHVAKLVRVLCPRCDSNAATAGR